VLRTTCGRVCVAKSGEGAVTEGRVILALEAAGYTAKGAAFQAYDAVVVHQASDSAAWLMVR
jgi:predicted aconitase with swiveling domain